jgi:hypothetical protein
MSGKRLTNEQFDAKLSIKNLNIVRIGNYAGALTKIKFKCIVHGEIHLAAPNHCLKGHGLHCCQASSLKKLSAVRSKTAANSYDKRLGSKNPNIVRVGKYVDSRTKIEFKCLVHNEIHLSRPDSCIAGHGLSCCGRINTLRHAIKLEKQPTELYLFTLKRFSEYVKVGVSKNTKERKSQEYGNQILIKRLNSYAEAYILEQAILMDKTLTRDCPAELKLNKWIGRTEVRKCGRELAKAVTESYIAELADIGINRFAKKHLTLSRAEKALLDKNFPPPP